MNYEQMKETKIEVSIMDLMSLYLEGLNRGVEDLQIDTDLKEEDDRTSLDFGEYMDQIFGVEV